MQPFPPPHDLGSWLGFERNDPSVTIPDAQFGVGIRDPAQRSGSWRFPYMASIFIWIRLHTLYILRTVTHYICVPWVTTDSRSVTLEMGGCKTCEIKIETCATPCPAPNLIFLGTGGLPCSRSPSSLCDWGHPIDQGPSPRRYVLY